MRRTPLPDTWFESVTVMAGNANIITSVTTVIKITSLIYFKLLSISTTNVRNYNIKIIIIFI